jgi:ABC-type antimicrobial peptide transport system permease subunit
VVGSGLRQLGIGLLAGLASSFAVTWILSSLLVGVSPIDPVTFASVGLVLTLAGLLGSAIPALRAANVDPVIALRHE